MPSGAIQAANAPQERANARTAQSMQAGNAISGEKGVIIPATAPAVTTASSAAAVRCSLPAAAKNPPEASKAAPPAVNGLFHSPCASKNQSRSGWPAMTRYRIMTVTTPQIPAARARTNAERRHPSRFGQNHRQHPMAARTANHPALTPAIHKAGCPSGPIITPPRPCAHTGASAYQPNVARSTAASQGITRAVISRPAASRACSGNAPAARPPAPAGGRTPRAPAAKRPTRRTRWPRSDRPGRRRS